MNPSYVLVTPARNEETTISVTIESVLRQSVLPLQWVIVSDGSTDKTDEIVQSYASRHPFIRLLRLSDRPQRSFSSVVFATEKGIAALSVPSYQYIGLLDADIRFGPTYYEQMFRMFEADPRLGVAGGLVVDCIDGKKRPSRQTLGDVAGAVQLFRRECFERIGNLVALPEGGWDAITCLAARMNGYSTRTFRDVQVDHLKPRNVWEGNVFRRIAKFGERDYALGNHPVFELCKCLYRFLRFGAFVWSHVARRPRLLAPSLIQRNQREQLARLYHHPFHSAKAGTGLQRQ
jgi:poly-beta-1,6-N-acetyl-D-glucosamine synthase